MPSARVSRFTDSEPEAPPSTFSPSSYQQAIFDWFAEGDGNLIVRARAGTGKTTTILQAIDRAPEDNILICAFNKPIQEELAARLESDKAVAQTLHSVGFAAIRECADGYAWKRVSKGRFDREDDLATRVTGGMPWGAKRLVSKLVSKAREIQPVGATIQSLIELAADFDLLPPQGDALTVTDVAKATLRAMDIAATREPVETGIDYADMIFLPLRNKWLVPQFDMVIVDEAQDMSMAQLLIARAVCHPYGRIVIVGDDRQAVYGFRGVDSANLDNLKRELNAFELPLNKTYRCPKRVVGMAQKYVPDFEVDGKAPDGEVDTVEHIDDVVRDAKPGDFVLSRKNAPLARVALALMRAQKRVKIQGRDIGAGLKTLIRQLAKGDAAESVPAFLRKLSLWEEKQIARLLAMGRSDLCEGVQDKANTIHALSLDATGVPGLAARIDYLFTDSFDEGAVTCSTVHKAKGLEADHVFVLQSTFFIPVPCECGHRHTHGACKRCGCQLHVVDKARQLEEENLYYVAITRTMRHLTLCTQPL